MAFLDPMQRAITAPLVIFLVDALSLSVYVIFVLRVVRLSPGSLGLVFMVGAAAFLAGFGGRARPSPRSATRSRSSGRSSRLCGVRRRRSP